MIKHIFLLAIRHLLRNKTYSILNLVGIDYRFIQCNTIVS